MEEAVCVLWEVRHVGLMAGRESWGSSLRLQVPLSLGIVRIVVKGSGDHRGPSAGQASDQLERPPFPL